MAVPVSPETIVVPLGAVDLSKVAPCTAVRSTLLSASLLSLRERGLIERYYELLPKPLHFTMQTLVAGSWVPMDVALTHYGAVEGLELSASEQFDIGAQVGLRIQASVLGLLARMARGTGVDPWTVLAAYPKFRERLFMGSDSRIFRAGPKEARVENFGIPLARVGYFRNAWRGLVASGLGLFCRRVFINEIPTARSVDSFSFRLSWV